MDITAEYYAKMYLIRCFEETLMAEFKRGIFHGTTHSYLGQEADAVGVIGQLHESDIVVSNHRCHGHFLAYGGDPFKLFAELMGKTMGVCGGRGGSQHIHWQNFYSNGIQGGIVPLATGMALAEKRKGSGAVAVVFIGDGTLGEGVVYETFNLAALWGAPILYVLENNQIAQTTPIGLVLAGGICARFEAFSIPAVRIDSSDVMEIASLASDLLASIRMEFKPRALVIDTARFGPHSKGDDTRPAEEIALLQDKRDPLCIHASRLDESERIAIEAEIQTKIAESFQAALDAE